MRNLLNLYLESIKDVVAAFLPVLIYLIIIIFSTAIIFRFIPQNIKNKVSERLQKLRTQSDCELVMVGYGYVVSLSFISGFVLSAFGREDLAGKAFAIFGVTIGVVVLNALILHTVKWAISKKN